MWNKIKYLTVTLVPDALSMVLFSMVTLHLLRSNILISNVFQVWPPAQSAVHEHKRQSKVQTPSYKVTVTPCTVDVDVKCHYGHQAVNISISAAKLDILTWG